MESEDYVSRFQKDFGAAYVFKATENSDVRGFATDVCVLSKNLLDRAEEMRFVAAILVALDEAGRKAILPAISERLREIMANHEKELKGHGFIQAQQLPAFAPLQVQQLRADCDRFSTALAASIQIAGAESGQSKTG